MIFFSYLTDFSYFSVKMKFRRFLITPVVLDKNVSFLASNFSKELNEKHTNKAFNKMKGYAEKSMILLQHVNKMGIKIWYSICSQRVEFQLGDQISTEINNSVLLPLFTLQFVLLISINF
jgi:hypothetical protein